MTHASIRCTRMTRRGTLCTLPRVEWKKTYRLPDPEACYRHLTADEMKTYKRALKRAQRALVWTGPTYPAYWRWPIPDEVAIERMKAEYIREDSSAEFASDRTWSWILLLLWQRDRCAVCGLSWGRLVQDHDHETGMFRGWLCNSCNVREGCSGADDSEFGAYRACPPTLVFGVRWLYGTGWADNAA